MDRNQLEELLKTASRRLGTTPEALKEAAGNGDLSRVLGSLDGEQSAAVQKVLNDPEAAEKLLSTPQARRLLQLFGKNGN